jgi:hypothetical protein
MLIVTYIAHLMLELTSTTLALVLVASATIDIIAFYWFATHAINKKLYKRDRIA